MKYLKFIVSFLLIISTSTSLKASIEKSDSTLVCDSISIVDLINKDSLSTINIIQPNGLNDRILEQIEEIIDESKDSSNKKTPQKVNAGKQVSYRILAFNKANQREQAMNLARKINSRYPQYGAKVSSNLPYWQVWVGLFFNEKDAQRARNEIKSSFPESNPSVRKANVVVKR